MAQEQRPPPVAGLDSVQGFRDRLCQWPNSLCKTWLSLWDSYGLSRYDLGPGSISQDAQGHWFINICATPKEKPWRQMPLFAMEVGLDLGLKDFAATSDGVRIAAKQFYCRSEEQLATAQRARKPKRMAVIHAKIKNQRKDFQHKLSRAGKKLFSHLRWQRELEQAGQNQDGEVRLGRRVVEVQNHAAV